MIVDRATEPDEVAKRRDLMKLNAQPGRFLDEVHVELLAEPKHQGNESERVESDLISQRKLRSQRAIGRRMDRILENDVRYLGFDFEITH
jgi:hypothetical protein